MGTLNRHALLRIGALLASAAAYCAGCAHGPEFRYDPATGVVAKQGAKYRTGAAPAGWKRLLNPQGDIAFYNDGLGATISANALCPAKGDPPLRVLLNHLLFGFTDRNVTDEKSLMIDGREALRAEYSARLDGVKRRFLVYVLKKDDCVFDMQYQAPEGSFGQGVGVFEEFAGGFGTVR
jgi:hypothetical protein